MLGKRIDSGLPGSSPPLWATAEGRRGRGGEGAPGGLVEADVVVQVGAGVEGAPRRGQQPQDRAHDDHHRRRLPVQLRGGGATLRDEDPNGWL